MCDIENQLMLVSKVPTMFTTMDVAMANEIQTLRKEVNLLKTAFRLCAISHDCEESWLGTHETPEEEWIQRYLNIAREDMNE